jgi:hypothetical protein
MLNGYNEFQAKQGQILFGQETAKSRLLPADCPILGRTNAEVLF